MLPHAIDYDPAILNGPNRHPMQEVTVDEHTTATAADQFDLASSAASFDPRIPLALERAIVKCDYDVLSFMVREDPDRLREGFKKLKTTIAENGATDCLEDLCDARCDRSTLLWLLRPFSRGQIFKDQLWPEKPGPGSIEAFFGLSSKKLDSLTKELTAVAGQLDIVREQVEFSRLLMVSKEFNPVGRLPKTLRTCASLFQYAAKHFAGNAHIYDSIAKARLTSYVLATVESSYTPPRKRKRREFHDQQIAYLISAVLGDKDLSYDDAAHRIWRQKHYQRLRMLDPDVGQRLPRLISGPPSNPPLGHTVDGSA